MVQTYDRARRRHHPDDPARPRGVQEPRPRAARRRRGARSPHHHPAHQKTGLALSGFDAYLREGRVLVFGESEIRYLESLEQPARTDVLAAHPRLRAAVRARHRRPRAAARGDGRSRSRPRAAAADPHGDPRRDVAAVGGARHLPVGARRRPRRAARHPRARRAGGRGERHRQERVRARPGRPRPSPGRRRRGRAALPGAVVRARQLPGADPAPHGDPRARDHQRPGHVRRRVDPDVEARRAGGAARTVGARARVRSARRRRHLLRAARHPDPDGADAGGAGTERRHPRRGRGAQPAAAGRRTSRRAAAGRSGQPRPRAGDDRHRRRRSSRERICRCARSGTPRGGRPGRP